MSWLYSYVVFGLDYGFGFKDASVHQVGGFNGVLLGPYVYLSSWTSPKQPRTMGTGGTACSWRIITPPQRMRC